MKIREIRACRNPGNSLAFSSILHGSSCFFPNASACLASFDSVVASSSLILYRGSEQKSKLSNPQRTTTPTNTTLKNIFAPKTPCYHHKDSSHQQTEPLSTTTTAITLLPAPLQTLLCSPPQHLGFLPCQNHQFTLNPCRLYIVQAPSFPGPSSQKSVQAIPFYL